ncbi:MAG: GGDEF domain-containing protein [Candidatus Moduliflexus flocculans]|nr:GGDEF domain-containing protein [Candidatus Moduliflexus flocculans]
MKIFQQALDREFARARRYDTPLSVAIFDIDDFKMINDTYGHQFGDKVLAEIARTIKNSLRRTDYVTRYGGEKEFIVILPETDLDRTAIPIERLRKKVEQAEFKYEDIIVRVTISIGIASLTPSVKNEQDIINRADTALYVAKNNGKNRVEFYFEN